MPRTTLMRANVALLLHHVTYLYYFRSNVKESTTYDMMGIYMYSVGTERARLRAMLLACVFVHVSFCHVSGSRPPNGTRDAG